VSTTWSLASHAGRVALVMLGLSAATALLVWVIGNGDETRQQLGFPFDGPTHQTRDALESAATNGRLAAAALLAAWIVGSHRRLRLPLDVTLALVLVLNTTALGMALGAYGSRLLADIALHGPLELAAFSLAGGAYLAARAGGLGAGRLAVAAGGAVVLVAAGAALETYVQIGADR
jgi:hypothetical protein